MLQCWCMDKHSSGLAYIVKCGCLFLELLAIQEVQVTNLSVMCLFTESERRQSITST